MTNEQFAAYLGALHSLLTTALTEAEELLEANGVLTREIRNPFSGNTYTLISNLDTLRSVINDVAHHRDSMLGTAS